jgi:hypothetical protein
MLVCFNRWTVDELKKVIAMLRHPDFDAEDVDPDLHRRIDKAVHEGRIKCFNELAVAVWARQAPPGWSDSQGVCREEQSCTRGKVQACLGNSPASQLIRKSDKA